MKKVLIVAAAAGLMTLAACTPSATNNAAEATNTDEANAGAYADDANVVVSNETTSNVIVDGNVVESNTTVTNTTM